MAEKDGDGPSLELPSLGFGRKRGKKAGDAADDAAVAPDPAPAATEPPRPAPEHAAGSAPVSAHTEPAPDADTQVQPTVARAASEPPTTHLPPVLPPEPAAPPLFVDEVQGRAAATEPTEPEPQRRPRLPSFSPMTTALLTGAVVGALMVGLTAAGFRFCELVQGAPSCGDPGLLLLLAIVIVVILVGKALLAAWDLPDPGSTSFLAVGLVSVVALLFLVDVLFNWWMIIVIPVLSMLCFALSQWVTTTFVDGDD